MNPAESAIGVNLPLARSFTVPFHGGSPMSTTWEKEWAQPESVVKASRPGHP
jgi:hypothetical protein